MKKIKKAHFWLVVIAFIVLFSCGEEGGLKGTLKIAITDAPVDADNIKAVNLVITNVEGDQNGKWISFRYFEQPIGVNLLAYTGGKSIQLIDQYTSPGEYSSLRLSLNIAHRNSSLIVNPQSNVVFKNGTSAPLYMAEGMEPEVILEKSLGISSRGFKDITLDFDLRKSIQINDAGEYILRPAVRIVDTNKSGHILITITKSSMQDRIVAYAYKGSTFTSNELTNATEGVYFYNAITSAAVKSEQVGLGFLEEGSYDLIFVKHDSSGKPVEVVGRRNEIPVNSGEQTEIEIDLALLGPS